MFKNKKKIKNIDRQDIVDVITEFERRQNEILQSIQDNKFAIQDLIKKGHTETNKQMQLIYAKKIAYMQKESTRVVSRLNTIISEIENYNQLLLIKDDYNFANETPTSGLKKLFDNPGKLASEVRRVHMLRNKNEERLSRIANVFSDSEETYMSNDEIHGISSDVNQIMALFETSAAAMDTENILQNEDSYEETTSKILNN